MHSMTKEKLYKWWYALCFVFLGIIDQRRGSAVGEIQMFFSNLTGIVIALLLLPSIKLEKGKEKIYLLWTPICIILGIIACVVGVHYWQYKGQWFTAVLNVAVWSYLYIYIYTERNNIEISEKMKNPIFWAMSFCLLLMQLSVHEGIIPIWYLLIYGGFMLIGIPQDKTENFFMGMLNGIIIWFFIQQIITFGFRPYDYIRYKGLYSGETQNGLFYMIVFCAFILKWINSKEKKEKRFICFFYFFMSAGLVSFTIFTGGKAPLLGIMVVTAFIFIYYNIFKRKTFYGLILNSVTMILCIILTFPATYSCIRYLPTILHHPIWFAGEYVEGESVCSFDPWDSSKYISFDNVINSNVDRILHSIGFKTDKWSPKVSKFKSTLFVQAKEFDKEDNAPGSSYDNPFVIEGNYDVQNSSLDARKVIYVYYFKHLNFTGHDKYHDGFWFSGNTYYDHAHNMFLQIAYDYGIIPGILFVLIYLYSLYRALKMCKRGNWICIVFLLATLCFGMVEIVLVSGQITVTLMILMFYFTCREMGCSSISWRREKKCIELR